MKRSIISLLVVGLCAGTATAALAQNVTADKPGETSPSKATDLKEMTNPSKGDQAMSPGKSKHDKGDAAFKKADKDNDGTLDRKEAKAMKNVAKNFDAIDTDKDGTVSLEEVHTYMKARHNAAQN
jgi:Ca2+-binding EF-hand superfamily protein